LKFDLVVINVATATAIINFTELASIKQLHGTLYSKLSECMPSTQIVPAIFHDRLASL
jgi:hypothetical protein